MDDIFEELKNQVGCDYISDLKCYQDIVFNKLMTMIDNKKYSLKDYCEVLTYICGMSFGIKTIEELREVIDDKMNR